MKRKMIIALVLLISLQAASAQQLDIENFYTDQKNSVLPEAAEVSHLLPSVLRLNLTAGEERTLTVRAMPEDAEPKSLTWSLSDAAGAVTISQNRGECSVRGVRAGAALLTVEAENGVSATVSVTVKELVPQRIELMGAPVSIQQGEYAIIRASIYPENASELPLIWRVNTGRECILVSHGSNLCKIRGVSAGNVVLSASTKDGTLSSSVELTVEQEGTGTSPESVKKLIYMLVGGALCLLCLFFIIIAVRSVRRRDGR